MGLETLRDLIVSIVAIAAIFGILYVYLASRHRERMAILEKNLTTSPFPVTNFNFITLKYGLFLVGLAIGFLILFVLDRFGVHSDLISVSMVCLFAGLGLIASFFIIKKLQS